MNLLFNDFFTDEKYKYYTAQYWNTLRIPAKFNSGRPIVSLPRRSQLLLINVWQIKNDIIFIRWGGRYNSLVRETFANET